MGKEGRVDSLSEVFDKVSIPLHSFFRNVPWPTSSIPKSREVPPFRFRGAGKCGPGRKGAHEKLIFSESPLMGPFPGSLPIMTYSGFEG